jgi:flagellar protein FliO/FliZ
MKLLLVLMMIFPLVTKAETAELATPVIPVEAEQTTLATKAESEIPVKMEAASKTEAKSSFQFKALMSFVLVMGFAAGAYFLIGKYRRADFGKSSAPQIKILTQHYLGPKKSLAIIRVAGESILVGITDQNINHIKTLSLLDEDIPESLPTKFEQALKNESSPEEDFAISGIKDFVSNRLKNMRSL